MVAAERGWRVNRYQTTNVALTSVALSSDTSASLTDWPKDLALLDREIAQFAIEDPAIK